MEIQIKYKLSKLLYYVLKHLKMFWDDSINILFFRFYLIKIAKLYKIYLHRNEYLNYSKQIFRIKNVT